MHIPNKNSFEPDSEIPDGTGSYALVEVSPTMIRMDDIHQSAYFFNPSWLNFTGRKIGLEAGTGWKNSVHPGDLHILENIQRKTENKEEYVVEFRLKRHDEVYRHILATGTPWFMPTENFKGYMATCVDISEMKEAEKEITNLSGQLKKVNEDFDQFIYATSHDLQEPLRTIASYVQLINKNIEKGSYEETKDFMNYVLKGVERMQQLIIDLLQFSSVNRKNSPFTTVDLDEVITIAITHLSKEIKENEAHITAEKLPKVTGDTFQLIRLFQNLIDNAIKFKAPGRKPELRISVKENQDNYLFAFKDNGIGIETKFYNRIFAIFQRLHTRNEYEGTGIGLAVCKKIVDRHGGEIWVESEPGNGSIFYFTIKK